MNWASPCYGTKILTSVAIETIKSMRTLYRNPRYGPWYFKYYDCGVCVEGKGEDVTVWSGISVGLTHHTTHHTDYKSHDHHMTH